MAMPPEHHANMLEVFETTTIETTTNTNTNTSNNNMIKLNSSYNNITKNENTNIDNKVTEAEVEISSSSSTTAAAAAAATSPQSHEQHSQQQAIQHRDPPSSVNNACNTNSLIINGHGNNMNDGTISGNDWNSSRNNNNRNNNHNRYYSVRPSREDVLQRLSEALLRRSLHKIDLSQRNLQPSDARLVKMALAQNANLTVLKLGYNNLGDAGVITLAAGIVAHKSLKLLDLGFNNIGDEGIIALAHSMQNASSASTSEQQHHQHQQRLCDNNGEQDDNDDSGYNCASSNSISTATLHTLYLAGNQFGEDGAIAMADFLRQGSRLRKLFMTGNRIGGDGVKAITEAILEQEMQMREGIGQNHNTNTSITMLDGDDNDGDGDGGGDGIGYVKDYIENPYTTMESTSNGDEHHVNGNQIMGTISATAATTTSNFHGMQELFLGGTGMGLIGCQAVSRLLEKSWYLRVISLPNCDIGDDEICMLASCIKSNKGRLPIESLQLSFNNISYKGLEAVANALWGSTTLRELKVDNNIIGDRGAHQIAAIIPTMKVFKILDVGFNSITASGLTVLMKTIAESQTLLSLSVSGNAIDSNAAKSVAFALAYNCSLQSIFLVHCSIGHEELRHIAAGIVSNSQTSLDRMTGFEIGRKYNTIVFFLSFIYSSSYSARCYYLGCISLTIRLFPIYLSVFTPFFLAAILLTLGFPEPLKNWTNEQVFNFIHLMWDKNKNDENENFQSDLERDLDPLSFLSNPLSKSGKGTSLLRQSGPLEASVVVEVAKGAFENLVASGIDVTSRRLPNSIYPPIGSPLATDAIIIESTPKAFTSNHTNGDSDSHHNNNSEKIISTQARSFVAHPESPKNNNKHDIPDPTRKKRIVQWLCSNSQALNELAHMPFNSRELWKLHQFYFTPVVKESGGSSCQGKEQEGNLYISSVPEVHRMNQNGSTVTQSAQSVYDRPTVPMSDPAFSGPASSSISILKRKVSYRFLGDASSTPNTEPHFMHNAIDTGSVAKIIEQGHTGHSLPPKTKRARRNRTRISFLPRIKTKLDGFLDVCHEKALITMRQLYFVEQAILSGKINRIESDGIPRTHLSGILASEAEMIIVDMM
jgi:Ran GTPase-activating protein (RanGAP) involved in mRNA processing and transport